MPYRWLINLCLKQKEEKNRLYEEERIFFASEYDRLNPKTREEATKQYYEFLIEYKKSLDEKNP